jgi:ABC-type Fe3+-siderophore transport system permease subunit
VVLGKAVKKANSVAFAVISISMMAGLAFVTAYVKPYNYTRTNLLQTASICGIIWAYFLAFVLEMSGNRVACFVLLGLGWTCIVFGAVYLIYKYPDKYERKL